MIIFFFRSLESLKKCKNISTFIENLNKNETFKFFVPEFEKSQKSFSC